VENVLSTRKKSSVIHPLFGAIGRELNLLPLAEQIGSAPRRSKDKNFVAYCNIIRTKHIFLFNYDFNKVAKELLYEFIFFLFSGNAGIFCQK
jgi:hypothetical protein